MQIVVPPAGAQLVLSPPQTSQLSSGLTREGGHVDVLFAQT